MLAYWIDYWNPADSQDCYGATFFKSAEAASSAYSEKPQFELINSSQPKARWSYGSENLNSHGEALLCKIRDDVGLTIAKEDFPEYLERFTK